MATTIQQVVTRLEALLRLVPGVVDVIVTPDDVKPLPTQLPCFIRPQPRAGARTSITAERIEEVRNYEMLLLVAEIADDRATSQLAGIEACYDWLNVVPNFFAHRQRRRLELNDSGIVTRTDAMSDGGPGIVTYAGQKYAAVLFTLPVAIQHNP